MLDNVSIKLKLIITSVTSIIGLLIILSVALHELHEAELGVARIYDDRVIPLEDLKVIADNYAVAVIDAVNKANAGIFKIEQTLDLINKSSLEIEEKWKKYTNGHLTANEKILAGEAESLFKTANTAIAETVESLEQHKGDTQGKLDHLDGPLYLTIDPISDKINELIHLQLDVAKKERLLISEAYQNDVYSFSILAAIIFSLIIGMSFLLYRGLMIPLNHMQDTIKKISSQSDLTLTLNNSGNNELSRISTSFNEMIVQMRNIIELITGTTDKLGMTSSEMTAISKSTNVSISTQLQEIEQVAAAMNEMVATSQEIANNASLADQNAQDTSKHAEHGTIIVSQAVDATNHLVGDVKTISGKIKVLNEDSENIGSVVDVIKGIAEQTNLLALNAAIEAARAGDQGRGFAVVADEVRTLAQRTQVSTKEIQSVIERLQIGTSNAASSMKNGQEQAENAGERAIEAGEALSTISEAVKGITDINSLIASAIYEQTIVSEEINKSLVKIQHVSTESSSDAKKIFNFSGDLSELAESLKKMVHQFKVI